MLYVSLHKVCDSKRALLLVKWTVIQRYACFSVRLAGVLYQLTNFNNGKPSHYILYVCKGVYKHAKQIL